MSDDAASQKPAILRESEFVVEEGILHRFCRTGAIWLNKLTFSAAVLWIIWLFVAYTQGVQDCTGGLGNAGTNASQDFDIVADGTCSVMLTTTSKFLGAMTVISFLVSVTLGMLGLVIGKRVLETAAAADEVGARGDAPTAEGQSPSTGSDDVLDAAPAAPGSDAVRSREDE